MDEKIKSELIELKNEIYLLQTFAYGLQSEYLIDKVRKVTKKVDSLISGEYKQTQNEENLLVFPLR